MGRGYMERAAIVAGIVIEQRQEMSARPIPDLAAGFARVLRRSGPELYAVLEEAVASGLTRAQIMADAERMTQNETLLGLMEGTVRYLIARREGGRR